MERNVMLFIAYLSKHKLSAVVFPESSLGVIFVCDSNPS